MRSIVCYETQHGSAKKPANTIAQKQGCLCVNVDTPFQAEDETAYDHLVLVFGFRGPYTAQLTNNKNNRADRDLRILPLAAQVAVGSAVTLVIVLHLWYIYLMF